MHLFDTSVPSLVCNWLMYALNAPVQISSNVVEGSVTLSEFSELGGVPGGFAESIGLI